MLPIWDEGRMIVEEVGYCAKGLDEVCHKKVPGALRIRLGRTKTGRERAGCSRLVMTEYKKQDIAKPLPMSVGTPGDKRSGPVEDRFRKILERRRAESERKA